MLRNRWYERSFLDQFEERLKFSIVIITAIFILLFLCFWRVQVVQGPEFVELARNNRIRRITIPAPRGIIFDSKGVILADNRPSFDVEVIIEDIPPDKKNDIARRLAGVLGVSEESILKRIRLSRSVPYVPKKIARDISLQKVTEIQEMREQFPGITIRPIPIRDYRFGTHLAHVLGYIGRLSFSEYKQLKKSGYTINDYIGKMGIEKVAEQFLKGKHGGMQIQVDYRGYTDKTLGIKKPIQGDNIYLTIDHRLQQKVESLLIDKAGAIVVMNPQNGDVLAMASAPAFDPNLFVKPTSSKIISDLFQNKKKFLINKAIRELYPPGSTFKPLVAMAALENAGLSITKKYDCRGAYNVGNFTFHCWYRRGHGKLNLIEALRYSCNIFFYNLAHDLIGVHDIHEWADKFGFGHKTGIDLDSEIAGVNPSKEWKKKHLNEPWYPGDTINFAIGQGYLLVTPLQVAVYVSALANGGIVFKPRILNRVVSPIGKVLKLFPVVERYHIKFKEEHYKIIMQAMHEVVEHKYGTGRNARVKGIEVSGKTGTVQVGTPSARRHHAWFIGFAPSDAPQIAVVVLVENGSSGSTSAAPLASEIIKFYFNNNSLSLKQDNSADD